MARHLRHTNLAYRPQLSDWSVWLSCISECTIIYLTMISSVHTVFSLKANKNLQALCVPVRIHRKIQLKVVIWKIFKCISFAGNVAQSNQMYYTVQKWKCNHAISDIKCQMQWLLYYFPFNIKLRIKWENKNVCSVHIRNRVIASRA